MSRRLMVALLALLAVRCGSNPVAPTPTPGLTWLTPRIVLPTTDPRFDQTFYDALVRGTFEAPAPQPQRRLLQSPSVYLQRAGLSDAFVAQIEQTLRDEIHAFTGGALSLARFESGAVGRPDADGWIVIELIADDTAACGNSRVGAAAGHIWINTAAKCERGGSLVVSIIAHEIGHALGFYHVESGLMQPYVTVDQPLTEREKFHGSLAYGRGV